MMDSPVILAAVEGIVDEAVVSRLIREAGGLPGPIHGKAGKSRILEKLAGYNAAAKRQSWVVLVDLDREGECVPEVRNRWLPKASRNMCFRIVVHEIESWLMADRERFARFLCVPLERVPPDPESIRDPKWKLLWLAKRSTSRNIREDILPSRSSGRAVGPLYAPRLIEFARDRWRPEVAARRSESLQRARECIERLVRA